MNYLVVASTFLLWIALALSYCPDGFIGHKRSCYHFSRDKEAMPVASLVCQHMGSELVEINSAAENAYIFGQIRHSGFTHYWIGANDIREEKIWRWYGNDTELKRCHYRNWNPGEPNNHGRKENCAFIYYVNGKWYDYTCSTIFNYICERPKGKQTDAWVETDCLKLENGATFSIVYT